MARRHFGNLTINVTYKGLVNNQDMYAVSVCGNGVTWRGNVYASSQGFGPGISYDSPKAYDEMARSAVSFATTPDGSESDKERDIMSELEDAAYKGPHAGELSRLGTKSATRRKPRNNPLSRGVADEHAAEELVLYAINDGDLYRKYRRPIELDLFKAYRHDQYAPSLALDEWISFVNIAAAKYAKEFPSPEYEKITFSPATKKLAAREISDQFETEMKIEARRR